MSGGWESKLAEVGVAMKDMDGSKVPLSLLLGTVGTSVSQAGILISKRRYGHPSARSYQSVSLR